MTKSESKWIPVYCGDGQLPEVDEDGYSDKILFSFSNFSLLTIGEYRVDKNGGEFYDGDDDKSLTSYGLIVNAWMPLPEPYQENENDLNPSDWKTDHGYMWLCPECGLAVHSDFTECVRCGHKRE